MSDLATASQLVDELAACADKDWHMPRMIPVYLAQFRQGLRPSLDDVLDYLVCSLQVAEAAGAQPALVQMLAWQAMALQAIGSVEQARAVLTRALTIAEPEGYVRTFVDEGAPMGELLATILASRRTRRDEVSQRMAGYVGRLLAALAGKTSAAGPAVPSSPALVESLERAGDASAAAAGHRPVDPRNRPGAHRVHQHGPLACQVHLRQAGRPWAHRGRPAGPGVGTAALAIAKPPLEPSTEPVEGFFLSSGQAR